MKRRKKFKSCTGFHRTATTSDTTRQATMPILRFLQ